MFGLFVFFLFFFLGVNFVCIVPILTTRHKGIGFWIHHGDPHSIFSFFEEEE
jgi:hypothetical protein